MRRDVSALGTAGLGKVGDSVDASVRATETLTPGTLEAVRQVVGAR